MCRLFAVRADRPVCAEPALLTAPHALVRQSCCDLRGECHPNGWGIGSFANGNPVRIRSTRAANDDPLYVEAARAISPVVVGHVRQASVGGVSEANTHPFVHGRWLFAHNGTIQVFAGEPLHVWRRIPAHLRNRIEGETDSEHLFHFLLGRIEQRTSIRPEPVAETVGRALAEVAEWYPGTAHEPTRLNVVLTDGELFVASRWGHSLHIVELPAPGVLTTDGPVRGIAVASEQVTPAGWTEVPDRSVVVVRPDTSASVVTGTTGSA